MRWPAVRETLDASLQALGRHVLRTALSTLGVVLGVAALVSMLSVTEGARREVLDEVERLGLDNVLIRSRPLDVAGGRSAGLRSQDAAIVSRLVPGVRESAAVVRQYRPVSGPRRSQHVEVLGVEPAYQRVVRLQPGVGRLLTTADAGTLARVCVLGASSARTLFGSAAPVGRSLQVGSLGLIVVGVVADGAVSSRVRPATGGKTHDEAIIVPLSTLVGSRPQHDRWQPLDEIWLALADGTRSPLVADIARHTLGRSRPQGLVDFDVIVPRELLAQRLRTQRTFNVLVASMAVIALLVGGIGIMNIMLAGVLERTPEIGLRRTVGATRRDVLVQFLIESTMMTLAGGALGVAAGGAAAVGISAFAGWRTAVSVESVLLALVASTVVGVAFGSYPAWRAARLEPIDAVRYE